MPQISQLDTITKRETVYHGQLIWQNHLISQKKLTLLMKHIIISPNGQAVEETLTKIGAEISLQIGTQTKFISDRLIDSTENPELQWGSGFFY